MQSSKRNFSICKNVVGPHPTNITKENLIFNIKLIIIIQKFKRKSRGCSIQIWVFASSSFCANIRAKLFDSTAILVFSVVSMVATRGKNQPNKSYFMSYTIKFVQCMNFVSSWIYHVVGLFHGSFCTTYSSQTYRIGFAFIAFNCSFPRWNCKDQTWWLINFQKEPHIS
jgi:hypothetical protein